jgi:nuclear factor 4
MQLPQQQQTSQQSQQQQQQPPQQQQSHQQQLSQIHSSTSSTKQSQQLSIQSQPPSAPSTTSTTPVGNGSEQVFYYSPYSVHDSSPQSLPEDQLEQPGEYEYWDDKMEYSDSSLNGTIMTDYDIEEEHCIPRTRPSGQITVVQPVQHQIVDGQHKYYKVGRMSNGASTASFTIRERPSNPPQSSTSAASTPTGEATCAVCGDGCAKLHYGVLACYGCKGFFRRTLTGKYRYVCRFGNNCVVDKFQRNSCRYCRFNRCLEVGMDPKAVRPDRDLTGKQKVPRVRKRAIDDELINHMMRLQGDDWSRKIPVDAKVLLMQLLNIESKVSKGDQNNSIQGEKYVNNKNISLRELFEQKPNLSGRRTEMRYEPYRMARSEELSKIAHRGAIAAVDWVDSLAEIGDFADTEDKISLVKACYAPLTIFNFSARTAQNTKNPDILCLCSYSYVPRKLPPEFNGTNHLSNNLIDRTLNELVAPLRKLNLREEEVVPLKAIIILNNTAKGLSPQAQEQVFELRNKIQDMLFQVVKELHHPIYNPSSRFGNLLLLLPTITTLSGVMCENMQFCQVFGQRSNLEPLLTELFNDPNDQSGQTDTMSPPLFDGTEVNLQPFFQDNFSKCPQTTSVEKNDVCTQTEPENCLSPMNSLSSISLISSMSSSEHGRNRSPSIEILQNDELQEVVNLESFESIFEELNNPEFSPENLFDHNQDIFNMNHGPL